MNEDTRPAMTAQQRDMYRDKILEILGNMITLSAVSCMYKTTPALLERVEKAKDALFEVATESGLLGNSDLNELRETEERATAIVSLCQDAACELESNHTFTTPKAILIN